MRNLTELSRRRVLGLLGCAAGAGAVSAAAAQERQAKSAIAKAKKKIVLIAGRKSHGFAAHEHNAGCLLLTKWLNERAPGVEATVHLSGWPKEAKAFDGADAVAIFSDGAGGHAAHGHAVELEALMKKGVGLAYLHYAVTPPRQEDGEQLLDWIGGYYKLHWSVNPHWEAEFKELPKHPVTRGVRPFKIRDEWYYHMRFRDDMQGVTPLLTATPPDATRMRPDGPHSGNPHVRARKGQPEHLAWVYERPDGARGFGFTGGHFHWNWGHADFSTLVLNALVWIAGADVPRGGVQIPAPTLEELLANQDFEPPKNWQREPVERMLESWAARRKKEGAK